MNTTDLRASDHHGTYVVNGLGAVYGGQVRVHDEIRDQLRRHGSVSVVNSPRSSVAPSGVSELSRQSDRRAETLVRALLPTRGWTRKFDVRIDSAPGLAPWTRARSRVVVIHDFNFLQPKIHRVSKAQVMYRRLTYWRATSRSQVIVVNSAQTLEELRSYSSKAAEKAIVLPLPSTTHLSSGAHVRKPKVGGGVRLMSFAHARNKGIDRILGYLSVNKAASLVAVCPATTWAELWESEACRLQVRDRVTVASDLTDEALRGEYESCDVFCMLSTYEGYGIPVAEALALGVPTVVSNLAVLNSTSRGFACVADGSDNAAVSAAINRALSTDVAHWQEAARVFGNWSWTAWVEQMLKALSPGR